MSSYIAKVPLVIAKDESDRDVYIYQDFPVPENVTEESVKRLLKEGFIVEVETPDEEVVIPEGDPTDKWNKDQLTAYAVSESIDVSAAKNKADLLGLVTKK